MSLRRTWTTEDEIEFIRKLGLFIEHKRYKTNVLFSRLDKLECYKKALENRVNWGKIDKIEVTEFLNNEIKKLKECEIK